MNLIDNYIEQQSKTVRDKLVLIRQTIKAAIPDAAERISYGMPTFWKGRNIIHFAAGKHHIGLYPGAEAVEAFLPKLSGYKTSKGAIQLPNNRDLPLKLVGEIALWSYVKNKK